MSKAAEEILLEKSVDIIPDVLANSGVVVVSYYEWLQNKQDWAWPEEHVRQKLSEKMQSTFIKIHMLAQGKSKQIGSSCTMRQACYLYALEKLAKVYERRGLR